MKKIDTDIYKKLEGLKAPIDKESMWLNIQKNAKKNPKTDRWYMFSYSKLLVSILLVVTSVFILMLSSRNENIQGDSSKKSINKTEVQFSENLINEEENNQGYKDIRTNSHLQSNTTETRPFKSSTIEEKVNKEDDVIQDEFYLQSISDIEIKNSESSLNKASQDQRYVDNISNVKQIGNSSKEGEEKLLRNDKETETNKASDSLLFSSTPETTSKIKTNDSIEFKSVKETKAAPKANKREIRRQEGGYAEANHLDKEKVSQESWTSNQDDKSDYSNNKVEEERSQEKGRLYEDDIHGIINRWTTQLKYKHTLSNPTFTPFVPSKSRNWKFGIGFGLGYGNISRSNPASEKDAWTNTLLENTRSVHSFHLDLFLMRKIHKNWSLSFGMDYNRYHDRLNFTDSETTYQRNSNNNDGPLFTSESIYTNYKLFQKYEFINLSLSVSKSYSWKSLTITPSLGVVYNHNFSQKGNILDEQLNLAEINSLHQYVESIPLRYQVGLSFQKEITNSIVMDFNLMYRPSSSITSGDNLVDMRIGRLSAGIGFQYSW